MRQKPGSRGSQGVKVIKGVCRATGKRYPAEEKTRIVPDSLKGGSALPNCVGREGSAQGPCYNWSKGLPETEQNAPWWRHGALRASARLRKSWA